jgi:hypothetical protein
MSVGTYSADFSLQQGVLALPWPRDVALRENALTLLRSLSNCCTPLGFFDPQHREALDRLAYGNEGARQRERCALPAMTSGNIDACCREIARVLQPSGYLVLWGDTFRLCEGAHHRVADVVKCVDLIASDNWRPGNGYRSRRRGVFLVAYPDIHAIDALVSAICHACHRTRSLAEIDRACALILRRVVNGRFLDPATMPAVRS